MKKILIVEDQPDIRKLIRMTLEFEDYDIHEAANADEGLRGSRGAAGQHRVAVRVHTAV